MILVAVVFASSLIVALSSSSDIFLVLLQLLHKSDIWSNNNSASLDIVVGLRQAHLAHKIGDHNSCGSGHSGEAMDEDFASDLLDVSDELDSLFKVLNQVLLRHVQHVKDFVYKFLQVNTLHEGREDESSLLLSRCV